MIDHLDHNLQIIACAGAGKTEAVAQRVVAQLQLPEVTPENVVAFTFNESAAAELKDRIATRYEEATGSRDGLADCYVGTIHGYCLELLQQNAFDALSFSVLNQIQQNLLISRASRKSGLTDLGFHRYFPAKYADLLSILREADVDEDKLGGSEAEASLHKYLDLLADKHYFDFTAILSEAVQLLEDDDAFRGRVAGKVKFLTVDEYQDVNPVQERLVRGLVDLNATVTVVGDDDQLLYAWRGSQVSNILGFDGRYDDVQIEKLEQNYRSSRGVVDFARHVIETNATRLDKSMVSAGRQAYEAGDIEVIEFEDHIEEAEHIAARIQSLIGTPFRDKPESADRGLSYSDFAVLVRVKKLIESIAEALEAADIRYVVGGVSSLFRAPEAEAARQLFFYLDGRLTDDELAAAWKAAALGSTDAEIAQLVELAKSGRRDIEKGEGRFGIYNLQRSYLDALTALELREPKIATAHKDDGARKAEVAFYNLGKFSEVISDFEQIYFQSAPADKYKSFADFLDYQAEDIYPEGWLEARYVEPDAVQILTIHQAKGLQWPAVFVPGLTKGRFPPQKPGGINLWTKIPHGAVRNQGDYENDEEDERRLLYVAQTRAKKYLTVSRAPYPAGKTMKRNPSWLWDEAVSAFAQVSDADSAPPQEKLEPTPRREVADVTLSFSELKYAFECPYSFKLRFLYGFNPPIAEALGYGKGLHDALFELHDRALNGGDTSTGSVDELIGRHMFLPFAYAELERTLTASGKKRLKEYIEQRGATFDDIEHAERPIEIDLGNGIRVNGRIDLVRRRFTNEVVVIDFKSNDRTQQEEVTDLQLRVYALGYEQATGERAAQVVVDNLDELSSPIMTPVSDEMLADARAAVQAAGQQLRDNSLPRAPQGTDDGARDTTCGRCDLAGICGTHRYDPVP